MVLSMGQGTLVLSPAICCMASCLRKSKLKFTFRALSTTEHFLFYLPAHFSVHMCVFIFIFILCVWVACVDLCGHTHMEDRVQPVGIVLSVCHLGPQGPVIFTRHKLLNLLSHLGGPTTFSR